jgi:hypothetical protein
MAFTPKASIATRLWLGILILVLAALFAETKSGDRVDSNFLISTNSSAQGAAVIVDGKKLGVIGDGTGSATGGGAFWGHLTRGKHLVELVKDGYKKYTKEVDMHGEEYMGVDLQPVKD